MCCFLFWLARSNPSCSSSALLFTFLISVELKITKLIQLSNACSTESAILRTPLRFASLAFSPFFAAFKQFLFQIFQRGEYQRHGDAIKINCMNIRLRFYLSSTCIPVKFCNSSMFPIYTSSKYLGCQISSYEVYVP